MPQHADRASHTTALVSGTLQSFEKPINVGEFCESEKFTIDHYWVCLVPLSSLYMSSTLGVAKF